MEETKGSVAYFCPECGSASVEYNSTLVGAGAKCRTCGWEGKQEQLLAHQFKHEHGTDGEVMQALLNDIRKAYGLSAQHFGAVLVKWGFFDGKNSKALARYMAAMGRASMLALIEERQKMEQERANGS